MKNSRDIILWFICLVLLQVLLLNNLQIAGVINPFIYIYFIIALPIHWNKILLIITGFVLGLTIDMFSNTWGIHAMGTTLVAYLRPYILQLVTTQEDLEKSEPRWNVMRVNYLKYLVIMVFIHHMTLFMLEAFSFHYFWMTLAKTAVSSLITIVLVFSIEKIRG